MMCSTETSPSVPLEDGLDLRKLFDTGSILKINVDYDDIDCLADTENLDSKPEDVLGGPVKSLEDFEKQLCSIDTSGFVKKKILENGGGLPLHNGCTVSIAYSGYWENQLEPFDVRQYNKPLVVDLKDNGLLPGLQTAVQSMLVGELSVFLLTYHVMYGELGIPPRIKPRSSCVFYIKLIKSILTPQNGEISFSEPNMFQRVQNEVKLLYSYAVTLHKFGNIGVAIKLFKKGVFMLHKCRLADEEEEKLMEKLLVKLYTNLAICYNSVKLPLKACTACNELNKLKSLWNNGKVLLQNAKALRMIGEFSEAEKRLIRAMKLCPKREELEAEYEILQKTRRSCDLNRLIAKNIADPSLYLISDEFKSEVDTLISSFKGNDDLCKLTLPSGLNLTEIKYIKEACIRENLFCSKLQKRYALEKTEEKLFDEKEIID